MHLRPSFGQGAIKQLIAAQTNPLGQWPRKQRGSSSSLAVATSVEASDGSLTTSGMHLRPSFGQGAIKQLIAAQTNPLGQSPSEQRGSSSSLSVESSGGASDGSLTTSGMHLRPSFGQGATKQSIAAQTNPLGQSPWIQRGSSSSSSARVSDITFHV